MIMILIYLVILLVIIYVNYRLIMWLIDGLYHMAHPEKKKLNKRLLKSTLVVKHGKAGKQIYKEAKRYLWRNHRIR